MTDYGLMDVRLKWVVPKMRLSERSPNNSQRAVALTVAKLVTQRRSTPKSKKVPTLKNRTIVSMPAGMGKSIVMGMLAALLEKDFTKITVLYTDADLMKFEAVMIAGLRETMSDGARLAVTVMDPQGRRNDHGHPVLDVPDNTLVIVDEADFLFLDEYC